MGLLGNAVVVVVCSLLIYVISEYRAWLDIDRVLYTNFPGKCQTLLSEGGSEDFAELDKDTILFSSGIHFGGNPGSMYALYTNGTVEKLPIVNTVNKEEALAGAHGINIWTDPKTDASYLYVVIHDKNNQEGVSVFEITKHPLTLNYIKRITDPQMTGIMNDLVVVDKDRFYITQSIRSRRPIAMALEIGLSLPTAQLIYYDGKKARPLLSGFITANGIALSNDKRTLYMAEFGRKKIHSLSIQSNGALKTNWVKYIGSGPDNIQVDSVTGDLWVGAFPYMYTVVDLLGIFGRYKSGGQVLRIRMNEGSVADIEQVFYNDGSFVDSVTVALYKKNRLFVGTVTTKLLMCDMTYLHQGSM